MNGIRDDAIEAAALAAIGFLNPLTAPAAKAALDVAVNLILFANYWAVLLTLIRDSLPAGAKFGSIAASVMNTLAHLRAHSLVQLLYCSVSELEHPDTSKPQTAIGYAIMDEHNYQNKGCHARGDSIEFLLDATKPHLVLFIESALKAVDDMADDGKAFGGYISMRFMKDSPSFLAMQRWPRTCSIEIAGLSRVSGTETLIAHLEELSRQYDLNLHWGQRNRRTMDDIEKHSSPAPPNGRLFQWRNALSQLSEHGRLANFSSEFTRLKGLENNAAARLRSSSVSSRRLSRRDDDSRL